VVHDVISMTLLYYLVYILVVAGDGRLGYPDGAPYDAIHVGAAAATIPQPVSVIYFSMVSCI